MLPAPLASRGAVRVGDLPGRGLRLGGRTLEEAVEVVRVAEVLPAGVRGHGGDDAERRERAEQASLQDVRLLVRVDPHVEERVVAALQGAVSLPRDPVDLLVTSLCAAVRMSLRKYSIFGSTVREPSSSSMQATRISRPAMYSSTTTRSSKLNAYSIAFSASSSLFTSVIPRELSSLHGLTTKGALTVVK